MADRIISLAPDGDFAFRVMVELGGEGTSIETGVSVRLRFRWHEAIVAWSLIVETPDGDPLTMQLLVRAGGRVLLDLANPLVPPGALRWEGRDVTTPEGLGRDLLLVWTDPG